MLSVPSLSADWETYKRGSIVLALLAMDTSFYVWELNFKFYLPKLQFLSPGLSRPWTSDWGLRIRFICSFTLLLLVKKHFFFVINVLRFKTSCNTFCKIRKHIQKIKRCFLPTGNSQFFSYFNSVYLDTLRLRWAENFQFSDQVLPGDFLPHTQHRFR